MLLSNVIQEAVIEVKNYIGHDSNVCLSCCSFLM